MEHSDEGGGYMWRKYGEKTIGGARRHAIRRSYYRCVCFHTSAPCAAKKRVDRLLSEDPDGTSALPVSVVYINRHSDEADGGSSPCRWPGAPGEAPCADGFAGMMRQLEQMRSEDLAKEMVSDLMLQMPPVPQMPQAGGWGDPPCTLLGARGFGVDATGDTPMEVSASMDEALASEAEALLSSLLEGPRACSLLLPASSPESQSQFQELGPPSFYQQRMGALALLNQEQLVSRAHALEMGPGMAPFTGGALRSGHIVRPVGGNAWMPSAPMPIKPQPYHLPASSSRSSTNHGNGQPSRGQDQRGLHPTPKVASSEFVSTEDAEHMLLCLKRGLQAWLV